MEKFIVIARSNTKIKYYFGYAIPKYTNL